ncbi:hypothetical protein BDZ91DRAFT_742100 [Kalaharituber pfeilii]|nr:hypothetical protein BDZ91DRAFT_742100 [Kalaharituber pfeilii]
MQHILTFPIALTAILGLIAVTTAAPGSSPAVRKELLPRLPCILDLLRLPLLGGCKPEPEPEPACTPDGGACDPLHYDKCCSQICYHTEPVPTCGPY